MKRLCRVVLFASLNSGLLCAQNAAPPPPVTVQSSFRDILIARVDSFMLAWKKQDAVALTATMAPDFLYVSSRGVTGREGVVGALTHACTLTNYSLSDMQVVQISPDAATLIYKIHQSAACAGHPDPAVVLNTDTLVRRDGKWVFLVTTSTPAE